MRCIDHQASRVPRAGRRVGRLLWAILAGAAVAGCAEVQHPLDSLGAFSPGFSGAPAQSARAWSAFRAQAARRIVAANPGQTYTSQAPEVLLAVPVLEIALSADGSVESIAVLRYPTQAPETVDLAKRAVRRAAPFGDMRGLPKPWKYTETFLFDDNHRFKPRTLED